MRGTTVWKTYEDYKAIYMPYRNFADRTRVEYQNDLEAFIQFLGQSGISQVRELGLPIIERYAAHLEEKGFASLTRKRKIVVIRSFLSFLYQESYLDIDIAKRIVLPLTENTTPYVLTQSECN